MELPDWLKVEDDRYPVSPDRREIQRILFESIFERVLEGVEAGITPTETIKSDPRDINRGKFFNWVNSNPERKERLRAAKEIGTLVMEDMLMERINGESLEDVQRSKLAVDTLKWLMQVNNRKRYGAEKETGNTFADGGITIVIGDVQTGRVIEHDHNVITDGRT